MLSGMCLKGVGQVLEIFVDDMLGGFCDASGRLLTGFWKVVRKIQGRVLEVKQLVRNLYKTYSNLLNNLNTMSF